MQLRSFLHVINDYLLRSREVHVGYTASKTLQRFFSMFNFEHVLSEFSQIGSCVSQPFGRLLISGQCFSKDILIGLLSNYVEYSAFCNLKLPELLLLIFDL